jgi:hypothetical protein
VPGAGVVAIFDVTGSEMTSFIARNPLVHAEVIVSVVPEIYPWQPDATFGPATSVILSDVKFDAPDDVHKVPLPLGQAPETYCNIGNQTNSTPMLFNRVRVTSIPVPE